ncbi:hypothetical protein [Actinocorallia libanotica]|uniref:Uncharacterized protein n=1 Tax=Actinocorallia libanotica TaxID=46162 RepID=A0ABP4CIT0_9ACTN
MASVITRIRRFLNSPQGRQARMRAERYARDPRNQARVRGLLHRFGGRRR